MHKVQVRDVTCITAQAFDKDHWSGPALFVKGVPEGKMKVRRGWVWEGVSPFHTLGKKIKI